MLKLVNIENTSYIRPMLTPKQQALLNKLKSQHDFLADFEPIPSHEYKVSKAISARVDELIHEFQGPKKPRTILTYEDIGIPQIFAPEAYIEEYLITIYGTHPWKIPLQHAPF